jgi:hypothetical protein
LIVEHLAARAGKGWQSAGDFDGENISATKTIVLPFDEPSTLARVCIGSQPSGRSSVKPTHAKKSRSGAQQAYHLLGDFIAANHLIAAAV